MTTPVPVTPLAIEDYDAIEAAVMETQRGRWFLTEYARRNRNCDTDVVLSGIERVERALRRERAAPDIDRIRLDLADMAEAISRTKQEIAQMKLEAEHGGRFAEASQELDAIVEQTEAATNDILLAAEGIQEVAWTLREAGAAEDLCEKLDTHATDVYTACSFQDLTGQRTRKVVTVLRYLESRINAMIDIWGMQEEGDDGAAPPAVDTPFDPMDVRPDAHLLNGPPLQGHGVDQSQVDELMWADAAAIPTDVEDGFFAGETIEHVAIEDESFDAEIAEAEASEPDETPSRPEPVVSPEEPAADVFESALTFDDVDLAAADVFSSEDVSRAAGAFAAAEAPAAPAFATVAVGNTLMTVEADAETVPATAPTLALVATADPIAELSAARRLLTFG